MEINIPQKNYFTVVIPTRERCDTLEHSLRTCVTQDYDDLEILVSDNYSQDRTREIVDSYKDPRIRYINTGKRVSMSDNFEFALSHVKHEGYVIFIGDDDGLMPNAIQDINTTIFQTGAQVLRWDVASYFWPNLEKSHANRLSIPSLYSNITSQDSEKTIQNVLSFKATYASLPVLYMYSAVKYEVISNIKKFSNRFYNSWIPDVYSGFAIAGSIDSFVNTTRPYVIAGASHNSNGASVSRVTSDKPYMMFLKEDNIPFHKSLVKSLSLDELVIECFLQASDHLPFFKKYSVDMDKLIYKMMEGAVSRQKEIYSEIKNAVIQIGVMHNLTLAAENAININPMKNSVNINKYTFRNLKRSRYIINQLISNFKDDIRKSKLTLDCSSLSVKNIYEASLLCDNIIKLREQNIIGISSVIKSSIIDIIKKI